MIESGRVCATLQPLAENERPIGDLCRLPAPIIQNEIEWCCRTEPAEILIRAKHGNSVDSVVNYSRRYEFDTSIQFGAKAKQVAFP